MIFAGNCLYIDDTGMNSGNDTEDILKTAESLKGVATHFRVKLWGGGTRVDKYFSGVGYCGLNALEKINDEIMPVGTECQITGHIHMSLDSCDYIWVGARNAQNYGLLEEIASCIDNEMVLIKRGSDMTIDDTIGLYDICKKIYKIKELYIVERGISTFDRLPTSRWSPDLKGVIRIKHERPDIFKNLVVDCSHSVGDSNWIHDTYRAFKAIGIQHFMFECTHDGKSRTDKNHMLSTAQLKEILNG